MNQDAPRPPILLPLLIQAYETWSLESSWFLFYGFFMLAASYVAGQIPLAGLPLALALEGPLAAGLVLATRRVLLQERPDAQDLMGGFKGLGRILRLSALTLLVMLISLAGLLCFIVPGILAAALCSVALPVMLLENAGLRGSLARSLRLVRPRLAPVAVLLLLQWGIQILLALPVLDDLLHQGQPTGMEIAPLILGLGLLGPFNGILTALLYFRLKEESGRTLGEA